MNPKLLAIGIVAVVVVFVASYIIYNCVFWGDCPWKTEQEEDVERCIGNEEACMSDKIFTEENVELVRCHLI